MEAGLVTTGAYVLEDSGGRRHPIRLDWLLNMAGSDIRTESFNSLAGIPIATELLARLQEKKKLVSNIALPRSV